tara:strand:+ start:1281 stop:1460 length:180 start_codon:yes stop_codon:yes gene_type:complete
MLNLFDLFKFFKKKNKDNKKNKSPNMALSGHIIFALKDGEIKITQLIINKILLSILNFL